MIKTTTSHTGFFNAVLAFSQHFALLTKARLSFSVVFSSIAGYILGCEVINPNELSLLLFGGLAIAGASNAFNQIIERDIDAQMHRTKNRPLPTGNMTQATAFGIAVGLSISGLIALYAINPKTAMFAAISMFLYTSVYTPLKTKTPLAVFVGAFPGAIPFMLGWVAATGSFGLEAGTLFMIQFFWQFPHFWAIGWLMFEDYNRVGINMLPSGKRDRKTALQAVLYSVWTLVISVFPVLGITGSLQISFVAAILVAISGVWLIISAMQLYQNLDQKSAKKLMIVSVIYISWIQVIYVIDKLI
jgi:protoheme IX farnesyltransferase